MPKKKGAKSRKEESSEKKEAKQEEDPSRLAKKLPKNVPEAEQLPVEIPPEVQKRLKEIKTKLDKFKSQLLKKFDKYIVAIALMPPKQPKPFLPRQLPQELQKPEEKAPENKDQINILVLVDDSDSKKMSSFELKAKLEAIIAAMAKDIDKNIVPKTLILSELWQDCYDGKYEFLEMIALSAPILDNGMLAAIKIAEVHKRMVLQKFERYIVSYVLAGSLVQGRATPKSDIDVFIVIDDTDVKRMTRFELKAKLRAIITTLGFQAGDMTGIKNKLNIQAYILTDFWESIQRAEPVIFTFLRDGVPFYDRGIFMPWKMLLKLGRIKPSSEAIELYMSTGDQMIKRAKFKITEIGMEDTYWAILTPSQAALMLYGIPPPTPNETPQLMRDIFVKKEKLLEEEYIKILEDNIKIRKDIEHGDKKDLSGKEADEILERSEKYLKRITELFKAIEERKQEESVLEIYDDIIGVIRDVLKLEKIEGVDETKVVRTFEDKIIKTGKMPAKYFRLLSSVLKAKADYDDKKLTKAEVEKAKKEAQEFVKFLSNYIEAEQGKKLERARIKVKHGDKLGEVLVLKDKAYIVYDVTAKEREVSKAVVNQDGSLGELEKSSLEDMDHAIASTARHTPVSLKGPVYDSLKKIFGDKIEIVW